MAAQRRARRTGARVRVRVRVRANPNPNPNPDPNPNHQAAQLQLREELSTARQLGLAINASRDAIGAAKGRIEAARVARAIATISSDGGGGGADDGGGGGAAEADAAAELHAGKQRYTAQAAELKQRKQHCAALQARYKAQQEKINESVHPSLTTYPPEPCVLSRPGALNSL